MTTKPPNHETVEYNNQVSDIMLVLKRYAFENDRKQASLYLFATDRKFNKRAIEEALTSIKNAQLV